MIDRSCSSKTLLYIAIMFLLGGYALCTAIPSIYKKESFYGMSPGTLDQLASTSVRPRHGMYLIAQGPQLFG
jgi:hypothetical protein